MTLYDEALDVLTEAGLAPVHPDTLRLFLHVYACSGLNRDERGWVPLYSRLREHEVEHAEHEELVLLGLLEMAPHNTAGGLSREYRVPIRHPGSS